MRFSVFQDSAQGHRAVNQDRMGYVFTRQTLLMLVADGMGGHERGEVAAEIALQAPAALFRQMARPHLEEPAAFLQQALAAAHRDILRYQAEHGMREPPRTTVAACVVQGACAWFAHAGDSRAYLVRAGRITLRTQDHSRVQALLDSGRISPEQAAYHPERNVVLNCLGSPSQPQIEVSQPLQLEPGDRLLLCSDGLWSGLDETELVTLLCGQPLGAAVPLLVERALSGQGVSADNTTALAMLWESGDDEDALSSLSLPEDGFASTIQEPREEDQAGHRAAPASARAQATDAGFGGQDFTEEEIERTIAEIRMAIERTQSR